MKQIGNVRHSLTFLILLTCSILAKPALCQQGSPYRFVTIGKDQGLVDSKPTCLFQDSYGFVWIGTQDGLCRFDGNECKLFEYKPGDPYSLPSNVIAYHAFHEDKNGDLWIATFDAGFVRFDRKTERFVRYQSGSSGLSFDGINAICGDGNGGLWIGTKGEGLCHFINSKSFYNYTEPDGRPDSLMGDNLILALCLAKDSNLWIGTVDGAANLNKQGEFKRYTPNRSLPNSLSSPYVLDIFKDKKGDIWLATSNGLNRWDGNDGFQSYFPERSSAVPKGEGYNAIQRVWEDREGNYWLGIRGGLLRFEPKGESFQVVRHDPLDPGSILPGGVHGIMEDSNGRLWFATDGGVCVLDKKTAFFSEELKMLNKVFPLSEATSSGVNDLLFTGNNLWVTTETGLFLLRPGSEAQRVLSGSFTRLYLDRKGQLFAGTVENAFYVLDPNTSLVLEKRYKEIKFDNNPQKPAGIRNSDFVEDPYGMYWMGFRGGLNRYDPSNNRYVQFYPSDQMENSISNSDINDLMLDRNGALWVATMGGVNKLSNNQLKKPIEDTHLHFEWYRYNLNDPNSISNDHVWVAFEDSKGRLWFGTEVGLNVLDPNTSTWRRFLKEDGLPGNRITGITEDKLGRIWVITAKHGLSIFNNGRFYTINKKDGLGTDQYPCGAHLTLPDGKLIFAGYKGANCIDPNKIGTQPVAVPLYFTELKLFNRLVAIGDKTKLLKSPIYLTREIELEPSQKVFSLKFSALNFTNPEKQVYRFRLEGYKPLENWQELGSAREITLTNLPYKTYTLWVESTTSPDAQAVWESVAAKLIIHVRSPWYATWEAYLLWLLLGIGLLYSLYKFRLNRKLAAAENRRLKEMDAFKTNFYTNITHEFRTPLTVILGISNQIRLKPKEWLEEGLVTVERNGRRLLRLVNQMLDLSKLESGILPVYSVQGNVIPYLRYLVESFHSYAASKSIELAFQLQPAELWMDFDKEKLETIVANLLSNALKFTPPGGSVTFSCAKVEVPSKTKLIAAASAALSSRQAQLLIEVQDTGSGISPEQLPKIFDRFYQGEDQGQTGGTGIGLALTKELVKLLGGEIHVESEPGQGACFSVLLPITNLATKLTVEAQKETEISLDVPATLSVDTFIMGKRHSRGAMRLLIVEDNTDVARYLGELLQNDYQLIFARDGQEGIDKAIELVPDLIVSDVMMPRKSGFDLCLALKADVRTSHIPIVLLTAKGDMESRLEGFEDGADEYLVKPFNEQELQVRIRSLLSLRQQLKERYSQIGPRPIASIRAFQREDPFMDQLNAILEQHYGDDKFGVPGVCNLMHMSRPNLFKKLKALTGKNIETYLRTYRLHKAHHQLQTTDGAIQNIAWDCGFKDPAYFTKAFQKEFGVPPSAASGR